MALCPPLSLPLLTPIHSKKTIAIESKLFPLRNHNRAWLIYLAISKPTFTHRDADPRKCIAQTQFLNNKIFFFSLTWHWDNRNHWSALFLYMYEKSAKVLNMRKHLRNRIRWWSMTIRGGWSTNIGSKLQWEVSENI